MGDGDWVCQSVCGWRQSDPLLSHRERALSLSEAEPSLGEKGEGLAVAKEEAATDTPLLLPPITPHPSHLRLAALAKVRSPLPMGEEGHCGRAAAPRPGKGPLCFPGRSAARWPEISRASGLV